MLTLAHLSDVHLAPMPRPRIVDLSLKRAFGYANWHRKRKRIHLAATLERMIADMQAQRPDHITVTGDLVNIGLPGEFATATRWLHDLGPPAHVTVVPGNHDAYVRMRQDPGYLRWADYMAGNDPHLVPPEGTLFPFVKRLDEIVLIGVSSAVPTPPLAATGRLGADQRARLAEVLRALRAETCFRVLLIHHPPLPGQASRFRGLTDAAELSDILRQEGAELVLHGHNHRPMLHWAHGPHGRIPVVGVPSSSVGRAVHDPLARYNLFRIRRSDAAWHLEMTARGLADADGPVHEIEHLSLPVPHGEAQGLKRARTLSTR